MIYLLRAREQVPSLSNCQNRSQRAHHAPCMKRLSGFPWGTITHQKNQALRQKHRAPWKTGWHFSCVGHTVLSPICNLTTSPHPYYSSINSSTLVGHLSAVKKIAPMRATYSTYLHVLHTIFPQQKRCRNDCFPPREGWPWL